MRVQYLTSRFPTDTELPEGQKKTPTKAATTAGGISKLNNAANFYSKTVNPASRRLIWTVGPDLLVITFATLNEVAR